jgi:hypothetical protein
MSIRFSKSTTEMATEMAVSAYFRVLQEKRTAFSGVNTAIVPYLNLLPIFDGVR